MRPLESLPVWLFKELKGGLRGATWIITTWPEGFTFWR